MRYIIIFLFLLMPLDALEVRTGLHVQDKSSDLQHYHLFAKQFADSVKSHAPVDECQVLLHDAEKRVEIVVHFERERLISYLSEVHNIRFVMQNDQDRYLNNFKVALKKSAMEIFSEFDKEAIVVNLQVK